VRTAAVWSLNKLGSQNSQVVKVLLAAMKDEAYIVRLEATAAMERKGKNEEVVQALIVALDDPCLGIRKKALSILQNKYKWEKRMVPALIRLLKDNDRTVRYQAINALEEIKDTRAVGPLVDAMSYSYTTISDRASRALRKITGVNFVEQAQWRRWFEKNRAKNKKTHPKK